MTVSTFEGSIVSWLTEGVAMPADILWLQTNKLSPVIKMDKKINRLMWITIIGLLTHFLANKGSDYFAKHNHFLLDFGDLLFMRRWYSSCAWLDKLGSASANRASSFGFRLAQVFMPLSPVTVLTVTKGSSNRSLRRAMISFKSLLSWTITCGWHLAKLNINNFWYTGFFEIYW